MPKLLDELASGPTVSFEFFPPKTDEARTQLEKTIVELAEIRPSFVSVTCGAGGLAHDHTRDIVVHVAQTQAFPAMAHLTCVGHTRAEVDALLADYAANGVDSILALAGDPPADGSDPGGDFRYASELVDAIHAHPGDFAVGVAAHPEVHPRSPSRESDRRHLAAKLAHADLAITQFFFDPADYVRLVDELDRLGVHAPIVPGLFPVTAPQSIRRFAAMNNTSLPEDLFARVEAADPDERRRIAVDHAAELGQALLDAGAPGLHVYTLNRSEVARAVVEALGLR